MIQRLLLVAHFFPLISTGNLVINLFLNTCFRADRRNSGCLNWLNRWWRDWTNSWCAYWFNIKGARTYSLNFPLHTYALTVSDHIEWQCKQCQHKNFLHSGSPPKLSTRLSGKVDHLILHKNYLLLVMHIMN